MANLKLTRKQALGIKGEAVQGTAVVPSQARDYILVENVDLKMGKETIERDYKRSNLDTLASTTGKRWAEVTFNTEFKSSGSLYPAMDAALRACGFSASLSSSAWVYTPFSDTDNVNFSGPASSSTLEGYRDGHKWIVAGAVGSLKVTAEAGKYVMAEFTFKGAYSDVTDATMPTPTLNTIQPPVVESAQLIVSGGTYCTSKFDYDQGNDIAMIDCISAANGVFGFAIVGRKPVGSLDPMVDTIATRDVFSQVKNSTECSGVFIAGSVAGNIVEMTFPQIQYTDATYQDRGGFMAYNLPVRFNGTGNNHCRIVLR